MRRRSERKKSTSPAPLPARRSRRSRKVSENEKTEDDALVEKTDDTKAPSKAEPIIEEINEERGDRASSEEHVASPVRKSRSTRTTPKKRNSTSNQHEKSAERKVETIPEEIENGAEASGASDKNVVDIDNELSEDKESAQKSNEPLSDKHQIKSSEDTETETERSETPEIREEGKSTDQSLEQQHKDDEGKDTGDDEEDAGREQSKEEVKVASSLSFTANKEEEHLKTTSDVLDIQTEDVEERNTTESLDKEEKPKVDSDKTHQAEEQPKVQHEQKENHKNTHIDKPEKPLEQPEKKEQPVDNDKHESGVIQRSVRKRKWLSKKVADRSQPVLAISTDSLKNIISDVVNPVPLSDVQLESSSEEEGLVTSDHETDERSLTPELRVTKERDEAHLTADDNKRDQKSLSQTQSKHNDKESVAPVQTSNKSVVEPASNAAPAVARSPSPARNRASHVLYITNLVRPFTVLQLKGLLARTGKIIEEDGFWIDRIKSKCYVAYTTEDEAIETRHALHGVRWPVSNPKCLNVDFGSRTDMDRAIQSTKNETPKYPQDNTRDNQNAGNTWSRLDASDKKPTRPVREWDVGKKEPNDHEKSVTDRRRSSKERVDSRLRDSERAGKGGEAERSGQDRKRSRERERGGRDRERSRGHGRSRSGSPASKSRKKENEPPIRLLDDLFRKTKGTPCIYWLPLTPEAIAEKEAFRQKRIEEHKQRIKEREERQKEREKDRDRQRDTRRNRSNDRRRSRSRDRERRRY